MLSWRPSGVIIAGLEHTDAARAMLSSAGIPVVEIMDTDGKPVDAMVGISHRRAGREWPRLSSRPGTDTSASWATKMPLDHRARKRFEGFTEVLAKEGVEIEDREFYSGGSALAKGREMTQVMLDRSPELDFLYYSNDMIGAGGLLLPSGAGHQRSRPDCLAGFNGVDCCRVCPGSSLLWTRAGWKSDAKLQRLSRPSWKIRTLRSKNMSR